MKKKECTRVISYNAKRINGIIVNGVPDENGEIPQYDENTGQIIWTNPISKSPTITETATTSKGGIYNPNLIGSGSATASGWIGNEGSKWYLQKTVTTGTATYLDNGGISMDITTTGGNNLYFNIDSTDNITPATASVKSMLHFIPLDIGGSYRFTVEYSVAGNAGGSLKAIFQEQDLAGLSVDNTITISGNTDRKISVLDFTTTYGFGRVMIGYQSGTAPTDGTNITVYSVKLEKVINTTATTLSQPTESINTIKGVVSTNIAGPLHNPATFGGSQINFGGDGTTIASKGAQSFLAQSSRIESISFKKKENAGTPTGDIYISIQSDNAGVPSGTILASTTVLAATWDSITNFTQFYNVLIPCVGLTIGSKYWIVFESSVLSATNYRKLAIADGTFPEGNAFYYISGAWSNSGFASWDIAFKVFQSRNTTNINIKEHNQPLNIDLNKDGLLNNAIIDINNGTYTYNSGYDGTQVSLIAGAKDFWSATAGGGANTNKSVINGFNTNDPTNGYTATSASTATIKVNLPGNGKKITIDWQSFKSTAGNRNLKISFDNVNYTTVKTHNIANTKQRTTDTYDITGQKTVYVQFDNPASSNFAVYSIKATFDSSEIKSIYNYPTGQDLYFTIPKVLPLSASKVYLRLTKYGYPALEYTDNADNIIDYVFLPIDVTGATNSSTTTYIKIGEGVTYTQLGDGESITLGAATSTPIIYCIAKIQYNRLLVAYNDKVNSAGGYSSMSGTAIVQVEDKGLIYIVKDLENQINDLKKTQNSGLLRVQKVTQKVENTAVETSLLGDGQGSLTIPANTLTPGTTIRFNLFGIISDTGTPNATLSLKMNGTLILSATDALPSGLSNNHYDTVFTLTCLTSGVNGTLIGGGRSFFKTGLGVTTVSERQIILTSPAAIDTTISQTITITYTWGTASGSNTITNQTAYLELKKI